MKRKLKNLKGTPPITKFFKKHPVDAKFKPLKAVVAIVDISPSKTTENGQQFEIVTNNTADIESGLQVNQNKASARFFDSNKAVFSTENENDVVQSAQNFRNKTCNENGVLDLSNRIKGAKKCLFNESELNHSAEKNAGPLAKVENCTLSGKETEEGSILNSVTKIENDSSNKVAEYSKLSTSECKEQSERKTKLVCDSDSAEQHSSVTCEASLEKQSCFKRKGKVIHSKEDTKSNYSKDKKNESSLSTVDASVEKTGIIQATEIIGCVESQRAVGECVEKKSDYQGISYEQQSEIKTASEEMYSEGRNLSEDPLNENVGNSESNKDLLHLSEDSNKDDSMNTDDQYNSEKRDDDSSDDELFNPVTFLGDNRLKPDVRTPEKVISPLTGSPLTPMSPYVPQAKETAVRLKYSLNTLLSEKPKQVEKEKQLARLQLIMQEAIQTGKNSSMADDTATEYEDDEDVLLPIHQRKLEKYKSPDKGFTEETYGVSIFSGLREPVKYENGCSQPFVQIADLNEFARFLYTRSDVEIRELLCCDWITHKYILHPCPPAVVQWLFHILCYHLDNHTVKASYNSFWSMLYVGDNTEETKELLWMPSFQDVMKVFKNYGANFSSLLTNVSESIDIGENIELIDTIDTNFEPDCSFFPLINFTRLIQFLTLCFDRYPQSYSAEDLERFVVLLFCISLDTRLEICQHDIKTCLQAMYNAVEPTDWIEEAIKISSVTYCIETHHRQILRIVQLQPSSSRGRDVKRLAALQTLASLLVNTITDVRSFILSDPDVNKDEEITNVSEMFTKLETLLRAIKVNDDTDYYELYTMIELLDIVVGAERLEPQEKVILERITKKLRSLNSDIRDPRAMFISRTKVKDLMLRTIAKFDYMLQGKKGVGPQRNITKYFVEGKSQLRIETLKDSEVVEDDEEELGSQASQTSSFILDPLSQTTEHSDNENIPDCQDILT